MTNPIAAVIIDHADGTIEANIAPRRPLHCWRLVATADQRTGLTTININNDPPTVIDTAALIELADALRDPHMRRRRWAPPA